MNKLLWALIFLPFLAEGQLKDEYAWRVFQASSKKRDTKVTESINANGYKYDLDAMRAGKLVLKLLDPVAFGPAIKKKIAVVVDMANGTRLTLSGYEIRDQLFQQYLGAITTNNGAAIDTLSFKKEFAKYLKGKRPLKGPRPELWQLDFGQSAYFDNQVGFDFKRKDNIICHIGLTNVTGDIARELPESEPAECTSVDRYLKFLSLNELNDHNIKPTRHQLEKGKRFTKVFLLTFDHNKYSFRQNQVDNILDYLEDSSLTIRRAYIRGMSSIEGDSLNNARLQQRRGEVLWQALQAFAEQGIRIEGDNKEGWLMFRSQMVRAKIHDFDSLTNEEIRILFKDNELRKQYEPYLKKQRIAKLHLNLYKPHDAQETIRAATLQSMAYFDRLQNAEYRFATARTKNVIRKNIGLILGVEASLIAEVRAGRLSAEEVIKYYPFDYFQTKNLSMARFYELKRNWDRGRYPVLDNSYDIIMSAQEITIPTIKSAYFSDANKPLRKAVDIQVLAYRMIKKAYLNKQVYFELAYEDDPKYYHLEMNKLYYNQHYLQLDDEEEILASTNESVILSPSAFKESRYYFYLKKWLLNKENGINTQVLRKDNYYFFDIHDLLYYNVQEWNVYSGEFYDAEITVEVMDKLINQLMPSTLCPEQKYEIALEFHRKVLLSAVEVAEPSPQVLKSYRFVANYYKTKTSRFDSRTAEKAARQLVFMNHLFYQNEAFHDAYAIMYPHFVSGDLDQRGHEFFHDLSFAVGRVEEDYK